MRGYRKIGDGLLCSSALSCAQNDNYELDENIRSVVHSLIIRETQKSGCEEYYVIVYRKNL